MVYAKCRSSTQVLVVLTLTPAAALAVSRLSNQRPLLAGLLDRQYPMVVIGVGYLSYFFPILKDPWY